LGFIVVDQSVYKCYYLIITVLIQYLKKEEGMKEAIVVLGFGYYKGGMSSQTLANYGKGLHLWFDIDDGDVDFSCSGMAIIPGSNPPTTQENQMYEWAKRDEVFRRDRNTYIASRRSTDTPENRVRYNKTQGNALQILHLTKRYRWDTVYIVDHPYHIPRLKIALEFMAKIVQSYVKFVYVPAEVDSNNNGQLVVKYLPIYWVYEKLATVYQTMWLSYHVAWLRTALQE
jgi:uncharacterized SAM-binding protein YcdF (DUF218 family)